MHCLLRRQIVKYDHAWYSYDMYFRQQKRFDNSSLQIDLRSFT